jgi:hypothetical protein
VPGVQFGHQVVLLRDRNEDRFETELDRELACQRLLDTSRVAAAG